MDSRMVIAGIPALVLTILGFACAGPVTPAWAADQQRSGYVVYSHLPHMRKIANGDFIGAVPSGTAIAEKVSYDLARGEYESRQITVTALEDLKYIHLDVETDLDVRVYRPVGHPVRSRFLEYSPNKGDGDSIAAWIHDAFLDTSNVIDLLDKESSAYFVITIHAARDAAPGIHRGWIRLKAHGKPVTELELVVRVRDFELQRARIAYFPFFYVQWGGGRALPKFAQTDQWIEALYRDMAEHSHTSVSFYGPQIDLKQLPPPKNWYMDVLLPAAKRAGLITADVPVISFVTNLGPLSGDGATSVEQKNEAMDWLNAESRKHGWPELISYSYDEPGYPSRYSPAIEEYLGSYRKVNVRQCAAMDARAAYGLGELYDAWIVYAGHITHEMIDEARRHGAEVWTYSCHLHPCEPVKERYYAGLYMWAYQLKGHTTWHHYAQGHFKNIWMRPGDDHAIMPTVGWEARRDGIDDYRYLQMLEDAIAFHGNHPLAAEATQWLERLRSRMTTNPHKAEPGNPIELEAYGRIRSKAADYIDRLGVVPPEAIKSPLVARLKDEAEPFRRKSIGECITGLTNDDWSVRRAAAWALFEMGPSAAPATKSLGDLLDDAEVRMPALRALEAIGPGAYSAIPKIRKLFSHPDAFIRLGAAFAAGGIGSPWNRTSNNAMTLSSAQSEEVAKTLRTGLMDESHVVAQVAAESLVRLGRSARPALEAAISLLDRPFDPFTWPLPPMIPQVIAAIGPDAGAAVPKLVEIMELKEGNAPGEIMALATIGDSASDAVPILEKYIARPRYALHGRAYYALFCIRGDERDLNKMIHHLSADEQKRLDMVRYLNALGVKAAPAVDQVRTMLASDNFAKQKDQLEAFLTKVKDGEGPTMILQ